MTKKEIIKKLEKLNVKHDPEVHIAKLNALLLKAEGKTKKPESEPPKDKGGVKEGGLKDLISRFMSKFPGLAVNKQVMTIINKKGEEEKIDCYSIVDNGGKFLTRGIRWRGLVNETGIREALEILINSDRDLFLTTPYLMKGHKVDRLVN